MQTFKALCYSFGLTLLIAPMTHATTDLSATEKNSMIKEDVASAQVMQEVCPAFIGKNAKFEHNMKGLIAEYLLDYSEPSISLEKLQQDAEYKGLIQEARDAAKSTSKEENKLACEEVLSIEM